MKMTPRPNSEACVEYEHQNATVPAWAWVVGFLLVPLGMFITLWRAGAIKLPAAALLAALTGMTLAVLLEGLRVAEESFPPAGPIVLVGIGFFYIAVCQLQFAIGNRHGIWSVWARRMWRLIGYIAGGMVLLLVVTTGIRYAVSCV